MPFFLSKGFICGKQTSISPKFCFFFSGQKNLPISRSSLMLFPPCDKIFSPLSSHVKVFTYISSFRRNAGGGLAEETAVKQPFLFVCFLPSISPEVFFVPTYHSLHHRCRDLRGSNSVKKILCHFSTYFFTKLPFYFFRLSPPLRSLPSHTSLTLPPHAGRCLGPTGS